MSNEQLFFGLSQVLRKFPKEIGKLKRMKGIAKTNARFFVLVSTSVIHLTDNLYTLSDRVLCHFCFKQKKVTSKVMDAENARKSQILISSIILLKTALDALPSLAKV